MPFSRQFIFFALVTAPLIPWAWKTALWKAWINNCYYWPCGLAHMIPVDSHPDTDFRGAVSGRLCSINFATSLLKLNDC